MSTARIYANVRNEVVALVFFQEKCQQSKNLSKI